MRALMRTVVGSCVVALAASSVCAHNEPTQLEPKAFVESLGGHLGNPLSIVALPVSDALAEDSLRITLSGPALHRLYMNDINHSAVSAVLQAVSRRPSLARRLRPVLRRAHPEGGLTAQRLIEWASLFPQVRRRSGTSAKEELAGLAALFEGAQASRPDTQVPEPGPTMMDRGPRLTRGLQARRRMPAPTVENMRFWFDYPADSFVAVLQRIEPRAVEILFEAAEFSVMFKEAVRIILSGGTAQVDVERVLLQFCKDDIELFYDVLFDYEDSFYESYAHLPELISVYRGRGVEGRALRVILDHTTRNRGRYRVSHDPLTWRVLDEPQRAAIAQHLDDPDLPGAYDLALPVRANNIRAIAEKYAAGRDPQIVADILRRELAGRASILLPLEKILPEHILRRIGTYEDCTGSNCARGALGLSAEEFYRQGYDDHDRRMANLSLYYDEVDIGNLQVGDVLFYINRAGRWHMSYYVGDGYVYTKNGMTRYAPYVFQIQKENEAYYFPDGQFQLRVFRPKGRAAP